MSNFNELMTHAIIFRGSLDLAIAVSLAAGQFASVPSSTVGSDETTLSLLKPLTNRTLPMVRGASFKFSTRQQTDESVGRANAAVCFWLAANGYLS